MKNLDLIEKHYPGRAMITLAEVSSIIPFAYKTLRNQHGKGILPFKTIKTGKLILVSVLNLAAWLDGNPVSTGDEEPMKRGRGRPRKLAAAELGGVK